MKNQIKIYAAPKQLGYAQDERKFKLQGVDAFSAQEIGIVLSSNWELLANGQNVPVYAVPITRGGPHNFASIDLLDENTEVKFKAQFKGIIRSAVILPKCLGISCEIKGQSIEFGAQHSCNLTIEINGQYKVPLTISINPPETMVPDKNDPNVIWFDAGIHKLDRVVLEDNQIVYISGGAILQANQPKEDEEKLVENDWAGQVVYHDFFEAKGKKNITIMGRGIIDTSMLKWHARCTIHIEDCQNVTIKDVTMNGAASWTLALFRLNGVQVDNIKLFGYRENSDGIDIVSSENICVRNCFVRTGDDAICVKAMIAPPVVGGKNILVEKCTIWNDKVRCLGITCESVNDISNVIFRDCDILYSFAEWCNELGSLCIILCDSATISNIVFEDIRIRHEVSYAINCTILKDKWSSELKVGHIHDIIFKNITTAPNTPICLYGFDEAHMVEDIIIQNLKSGDNYITDLKLVQCNSFTRNIKLLII